MNPANHSSSELYIVSGLDTTEKFVLVADDDPAIVRLIKAILVGEGFIPVAARDGKEAYKILQSGGPLVAAILDVAMPYIQGTELVRFMQTDERFKSIPVIVMTAEHDPRITSGNLSAGAIVFLPKPFKNAQLKLMLNTLIEGRDVHTNE